MLVHLRSKLDEIRNKIHRYKEVSRSNETIIYYVSFFISFLREHLIHLLNLDPIMDVKADGKHTVVFTLNDSNADFPYIISDYHLTIFPADQYPTKYAELPSL